MAGEAALKLRLRRAERATEEVVEAVSGRAREATALLVRIRETADILDSVCLALGLDIILAFCINSVYVELL